MMYIFIDSSVNPTINRAIGSYLILSDADYSYINDKLYTNIDIQKFIQPRLQYHDLDSNSSTSAELETAKKVLSSDIIQNSPIEVKYLYTDCNNLYNINRSYSPDHHNAKLYDELKRLIVELNVEVIKAKGHCKQELQSDTWQKIFSIVDKNARKILRQK
jgi:hypothetical protein